MALLLHHSPHPSLLFFLLHFCGAGHHSWQFWQSVSQTGESCRTWQSTWLTRWWTANLKTSCPDHAAICRSQFNTQMRLWLQYELVLHFGFLALWAFYPFAAAFVTTSAFGVVIRSPWQTAGMIYWCACWGKIPPGPQNHIKSWFVGLQLRPIDILFTQAWANISEHRDTGSRVSQDEEFTYNNGGETGLYPTTELKI